MSGETEAQESGWTVDTLKYHTDQRFAAVERIVADYRLLAEQRLEAVQESMSDLRQMLDERYQTQTKATDAAFAAQQKAMETAFTAADRAVQTALQSAKEAVVKAEGAAEKRFEAVNEFRGQLADQASTFVTRVEADAVQVRNVERINDLTERVNIAAGNKTGSTATVAALLAAATVLTGIIAVVITLVLAT